MYGFLPGFLFDKRQDEWAIRGRDQASGEAGGFYDLGREQAHEAFRQGYPITGIREPESMTGLKLLPQGFQRRQAEHVSSVCPEVGIPREMQLRESDGLKDFAGVRLVEDVTHCDRIAVDREWLEPDGLHHCVVHDQVVSIKLLPSAATIFGRPGARAREGESTAGQRMKIDTGPIFSVHDQGAVRRRPPRQCLRVAAARLEIAKPGDSPLAHDGVTT